jgi:predicted Fe-S protein YdhL (DUF1289 family)
MANDSPCVRNCCLDPDSDRCLGCGRHVDDIVAWNGMSAEQRRTAMSRAEEFMTRRERGGR